VQLIVELFRKLHADTCGWEGTDVRRKQSYARIFGRELVERSCGEYQHKFIRLAILLLHRLNSYASIFCKVTIESSTYLTCYGRRGSMVTFTPKENKFLIP
jgi:hypothetical protein